MSKLSIFATFYYFAPYHVEKVSEEMGDIFDFKNILRFYS